MLEAEANRLDGAVMRVAAPAQLAGGSEAHRCERSEAGVGLVAGSLMCGCQRFAKAAAALHGHVGGGLEQG